MIRMTAQQRRALFRLYLRSPDDAANVWQFMQRARQCYGDYIGIEWCGMFVGIEPDGYSHT